MQRSSLPPGPRPRAVLVMCFAVVVAGAGLMARQEPARARRPLAGEHFSADLTVRHALVGADGAPREGSPPAIVMRLERTRTAGRWHTSLRLRASEPAVLQALNGPARTRNPFALGRIEIDDDTGAATLFDESGREVHLPSVADRDLLRLATGRDPGPRDADGSIGRIDRLRRQVPAAPQASLARGRGGLLVDAADRSARRAALERRLGRAIGKVRGLDRFVTTGPDETEEVLVAPDEALPVEINNARDGRLFSHATFEYRPHGAGAILRHRARVERLLAADRADRLVTELEVSNVSTDAGGAQ